MFNLKIVGLNETIANLTKVADKIKKAKYDSQVEASQFGLLLAKEKVPKDTLATFQGIYTKIDSPDESLIISVADPSDLVDKRGEDYYDKGKPLNIYLDEGYLEGLNWGERTTPKNGEFGFMKTTVEPTREEFIRLLNVEIQEATK